MIDVDDVLRSELGRAVDLGAGPDWNEIATRAGLHRERARRRWRAAGAMLAVAVLLGIATPLGSAIIRGFDDFSAWLSGHPGSPVSDREQREFDAANARSWLGFPQGTELRRLISRRAGAATVELLGFRSGTSALCLRLSVTGKSRTSTLGCAPLDELRRDRGPARVVLTDYAVGKGKKRAWYGIDRLHSANLQLTAGIVADGVRAVVLEDDQGRHEVPTEANAFLYVASAPEVGQRVRRVWARTATGLVAVPFVAAPFGFRGGPPAAAAVTPPRVERRVRSGRIAWLERREQRGQALSVLPFRLRSLVYGRTMRGPRPAHLSNVVYGRVLTPDPDRPVRIVLTLNSHRRGGPAAGLCTWTTTRGGVGSGGCSPYPGVFERSPIPFGMSGGGSGTYITIEGAASDEVARVEALLANGETKAVLLRDSTFIGELARTDLPARLVAYDAAGRVIHVGDELRDFGGPSSSPTRGRAVSLLRVSGPRGMHAELLVGPATGGGECVYVRHFVDRSHTGTMISCQGRTWSGPALRVGTQFSPPRFLSGRVRADVRTVRLRFADGSHTLLRPTRGYLLWAAPADRLVRTRALVGIDGVSARGAVVARLSFRPPRR